MRRLELDNSRNNTATTADQAHNRGKCHPRQEGHEGQKVQLAERRIPTMEDLVDASSSIPDYIAVDMTDVEDAMVRDQLLLRQVLLRTA